MIIFKTAEKLSQYLVQEKSISRKTGFVPTMGALHAGHLSLLDQSLKENDLTVCSIFVNPTQFNNAEDFKHYPVTLEQDIEKLAQTNCNILFLPSVQEIYPDSYKVKHFDLGYIEEILEGYYRPNHFQGVCQVVDRLLEIIVPHSLYMGQKDYQQCIVIKRLLELTGRKEEISLKIIPTLRETDGLAMSSRNLRLNPSQRQKAIIISKSLQYIKDKMRDISVQDLKQRATELLQKEGFQVDYVEIADVQTLKPVHDFAHNRVALIAASLDGIRLIDNMVLN